MSRSYKVVVKGVSYQNDDGSYRQDIIKNLQIGDKVNFIAEPINPYDRWAVAVVTSEGGKIGYLPSDARDASTLLKGEPIQGNIAHLTGATNWFSRVFLRKKYIGVVLLIEKGKVDCSRCHVPQDWLAEKFDHNRDSKFEIKGGHINVPCKSCHKPFLVSGKSVVKYKSINSDCSACHEFRNDKTG